MSNEEKEEGKCNAKAKSGGLCALPAGYDTDHLGEGRCKFHGGAGSGAPKGNTNAMKHGLYAQRSNYYSAMPAEEKAWIDALVESMLEDAPFSKENFQKFQMLREIGIDMHKKRQANDYTEEEGLIQENIVRDEEGNPMMDSNGDLLTDTDENPINLTYDRLDRSALKKMKDLGLLDDPESKKAQAGESISEQLSDLRRELHD